MPRPLTSNLKKFGLLLGFDENTSFLADEWKTSPNIVEMNRGLRYITINGDIVYSDNNFDEKGDFSNRILSLPVPTNQSLFGETTSYSGLNIKVPVRNGTFNEIEFSISNNTNNVVSVSVLIEGYLE
jgi:hypothetical protein